MKNLTNHEVVSRAEWLAARKVLLAKEKELTRLRDALAEQRRALPWERVEKTYVFDGPDGAQTLDQLFDGRSQLVVYHAMFDPKTATARTPYTTDAACAACSFWMDNFNGIVTHLVHRDVTLIASSRAPVEKLAAYQKRMGWTFKWVSAGDGDFNYDYGVSLTEEEVAKKQGTYNYEIGKHPPIRELPGASVFYKDPSGQVFHTYSTYGRGLDILNVAYHYLDLVPKGRDEVKPAGAMGWLRRHDEYSASEARACH